MTIQQYITREDSDIAVTVTLSYYPAERGGRDRFGCPLEPDSGATFEVESVIDNEGNQHDLTANEEQAAIETAFSERAAFLSDN